MVEFIEAVTSWNVTIEELITIGERIANIQQAFNIREGINPLNFKVPERRLGRPPIKYGPLADVTIDKEIEDAMISFLTVMDWDIETAKPSKKAKRAWVERCCRIALCLNGALIIDFNDKF